MPYAPTAEEKIREIYQILSRQWGPQHWWPARSRFEVVTGAFLTQNTGWSNVERALERLRMAGVLNLEGIRNIQIARLQKLIRPSGYFRQKATRLKNFVDFLDHQCGGSFTRLFSQPTSRLRDQLLGLNGIGPETADSILLYAGQHPVFVVDTYTRRVATRHALAPEKAGYEELRLLFERALQTATPNAERGEFLPAGASHKASRMSTAKRCGSAQVFNEMHAFMVGIGKNYCHKTRPDCQHCPLAGLLPSPMTPAPENAVPRFTRL